ncbi:class I histocompatibility antigen, F10 alpha chain-like [Centropristis striata]|uniref:class I histocompatibility antigen, F10 alpha chain-like n=1 Tax=Centropristis striata TaxID=184440 RepID=UPI0027E140F3|nr:class I histocompatibility antigen, F10 alpha chain-like [Centropristis striata]
MRYITIMSQQPVNAASEQPVNAASDRQMQEAGSGRTQRQTRSNSWRKFDILESRCVCFEEKMRLIAVLVLLGTGMTVNCEKHSLTYIYTAFSKPVRLPGFHEFTAMGQIDGRMIDYFDSDDQKKVPKQEWMEKKLDKDYWDRGTESRQSKQQWFKDNINILKERMRQNDSDVHVLQWMHGCEAESEPGGDINFVRGMDRYSYDGDDFLSFDDTHLVWADWTEAAVPTKKKWDDVQVLIEYAKGYLEKECMDWLRSFLYYEKQQLMNAPPPKVYVFSKNTYVEANLLLTCLATGYYPREIILQIKRNGRILEEDDGLFSSGSLPNGDGTFQRRDWVEILRSDQSKYTCTVIDKASNVNITVYWDHKAPDSSNGPVVGGGIGGSIGGALLVVVIVLGVVLAFCYKKGKLGKKRGSDPSINSNRTDGSDTPLTTVTSSNNNNSNPDHQVEVHVNDNNDISNEEAVPLTGSKGSLDSDGSGSSGVSSDDNKNLNPESQSLLLKDEQSV